MTDTGGTFDLATTAFAFRGYNITNLGRTADLLADERYCDVLTRYLEHASAVATEVIGRPVDLAARIVRREEPALSQYAEAIALIIAVDDLDAAVGGYQRLLDKSEPDGTSAGGAYSLIGPHRVEPASAASDGPVANQLSERGTGLFGLQWLASEERDIDPSAAGGARLRLVAR